MNLLFDKWIPVMGSKEPIAPWEITANGGEIKAVKSVRPDFDAALLYFLIGLYQFAYFEPNEWKWTDRFFSPPTPEEIKKRFEELEIKSVFELLGDGKRFMQEQSKSLSDSKLIDINQLFIDYPPRKTIEDGNDHLFRHEPGRKLCLSCCATALYSKQCFTGYGGVGHRSSIHNGTPVMTFLFGNHLWETVWLNVLSAETSTIRISSDHIDKSDIFFWLRDSLEDCVGKEDAPKHFYNADKAEDFYSTFWPMPERVRLGNAVNGVCYVCKTEGLTIGDYYNGPFGVDYRAYWPHQLVPSIIAPPSTEEKNEEIDNADKEDSGSDNAMSTLNWNPIGSLIGKKLGEYTYIDWLGLALSDWGREKNIIRPAKVVSSYLGRRSEEINRGSSFSGCSSLSNKISLWVAGYEYDRNKCSQFINSQVPIVSVATGNDPETMYAIFERAARNIANDAKTVLNGLHKQLREIVGVGLNDKVKKIAKDDAVKLSTREFTNLTEARFFRLIREAAKDPGEYGGNWEFHEMRCGVDGWRKYLANQAVKLFDNNVNIMQLSKPKDVVKAVKARSAVEKLGIIKQKSKKPVKK